MGHHSDGPKGRNAGGGHPAGGAASRGPGGRERGLTTGVGGVELPARSSHGRAQLPVRTGQVSPRLTMGLQFRGWGFRPPSGSATATFKTDVASFPALRAGGDYPVV